MNANVAVLCIGFAFETRLVRLVHRLIPWKFQGLSDVPGLGSPGDSLLAKNLNIKQSVRRMRGMPLPSC